jgi:N-acetyl sugar amidotransferase
MSSESKRAPMFCKRCLYGDTHPLGLVIDEEGICSGCRIHEEKDTLDWKARWNLLEKVVQPYRSRTGKNYDCIVPVTGGAESYWLVHLVKERLGLDPLLVTYNRYFNTPLGIRNLANLRIRFDCDILIQNVNPVTVKNITRSTLRRFGSIYWPCLAGQTVFPVQTAVSHGIPLIIWGGHQGVEQVGMFSHEHEVEMTRRYRKDHDLMGYEADNLVSVSDNLRDEDVWQYRYPDDSALGAVGVRGIYLSNYVRWDPKAQDEAMIDKHNFHTAARPRTFDSYEHVDCYNYLDMHDMLKMFKHGYGKVTDHASREIRHGRLTRSAAEQLVRHYERSMTENTDLLREWLGVTETGFNFLINQHRNPKYWHRTGWDKWEFKGWSVQREAEGSTATGEIEGIERGMGFVANDRVDRSKPRKYIIIGKGYPD